MFYIERGCSKWGVSVVCEDIAVAHSPLYDFVVLFATHDLCITSMCNVDVLTATHVLRL